jgi:hypothetical protein
MSALQMGASIPGLPIAWLPERTVMIDAGAVTIGVEYRTLDGDVFRQNLAEGSEQMEELTTRVDLETFSDEGISVHVIDTLTGFEHVRFDDFVGEPHYHYVYPDHNLAIPFDTHAMGPMWPWVLTCLRDRLPSMLEFAGADELAGRIDVAAVRGVLDEVVAVAAAARERSAGGEG